MSINSVNETDLQDDSRVVEEACRECGMPCTPTEYHPYAACLMFRGCHNSKVVRENLRPLSLLAEAERLIAVASDKMHERDKELIRLTEKNDALQSRLEQEQASLQFVQAKLDAVPEIISGLEMANVSLIGSNHAHRDIQKAIDFLLSAALGGELGNEEVV